MSSYYERVYENLEPNRTARVEDINLIQSNIQDAFHDLVTDVLGNAFILGENEDDLKLIPTSDYIDQCNYNYDNEKCWIHFYDRYLRQPIYIEKSSIESVTLYMKNETDISVTVYAEIRDSDFDIITNGEASAILEPTTGMTEKYTPITFTFNAHHLPVGEYYIILRPIDISTTDFAMNGDETNHTINYTGQEIDYDAILSDCFLVRCDINGTYMVDDNDDGIGTGGRLEGSYDGTNYLEAYRLPEQINDEVTQDSLDEEQPNYDLCFEERYSSGTTFLINPGSAVIAGQPVDSFDTHIKINAPSSEGDRVDLVVLTADGKLEVVDGTVGGEYPPSNNGLKIAYITSYQNGTKVPMIEQNDENDMTRTRDILERIRRLEKKAKYQMENNSPTRIKYNCIVDPVMFKNGLSTEDDAGEGTYKLTLSSDENGNDVVTNTNGVSYIWSIINNNTKYTYTETTKTSAYCQIFNVDIPINKPKSIGSEMKYTALLSEKNITTTTKKSSIKKPIKNEKIKIVVKKGKTTKYTKTIQTNNKGVATFSNFWAAKLGAGKYTIESTVGDATIKTKLTVHKSSYTVSKIGQTVKKITVKDSTKKTTTTSFSNNIITGDNSLTKSHITVNTKKGIAEISKVSNKENKYTHNHLLSPTSNGKASTTGIPRSTHEYTIKSSKKSLNSTFPVMHFKFKHDTYIKSITPYIRDFKNMKSFGIVFFKNPYVEQVKNHKRKTINKKMTNDKTFPNVYKGEKKLTKFIQNNDKKRIEEFVTFDVNKTVEAGTYTLICWGRVKNTSYDGHMYTGEYKTNNNLNEYGIGQKSTGSSNLSLFKLKTTNLTGRHWNAKIIYREDKYYEKGTLTSVAKKTPQNIKSCSIKKNIKVPNGCKLTLKVSNDGGSTWVNASTAKKVNFTSMNNSFRWKMTFEGNQYTTPQLLYKENKKYAIQFNLSTESYTAAESTQAYYVPYEDYGCCYETPLLNANAITRTYVANSQANNRFSEWEFARIFMEDESDNTKIDIGISYSDDSTINVATLKPAWEGKIFFSQFFADLKLSDFSTESVDYDNYEGNVEFDEHNYRFTMNSEYLKYDNSSMINTIPTSSTEDYHYGNINGDTVRDIINNNFVYENKDFDIGYQYEGNKEDEVNQYSGMHITKGPYVKSTFIPNGTELGTKGSYREEPIHYNATDSEDIYSPAYIINGVTFTKALEVDESRSEITIYLYPEMWYKVDENKDRTIFPAGTFSVVIGLTADGTLAEDSSYGKSYVINEDLVANQWNPVTINLNENIDGYAESGIHSIGITVNETINDATNMNFIEGDSIGIGPIGTSSYNRRPYTAYTYTQKWDRLQWQLLNDGKNNDAEIYNMFKKSKYMFFYPTSKLADSNANNTDSIESNDLPSQSKYAYKYAGTSLDKSASKAVTKFTRNNSTITATAGSEYSTTSSNEVLFVMPKDKTGEMFKIETALPFSIYDFIEIEYYVYNTFGGSTQGQEGSQIVTVGGKTYEYNGYISKGDVLIKFYDTTDTINNEPVETFALPSWGRIQQKAEVEDKTVHAWFKKRSNASNIKAIVVERKNPSDNGIPELKLVLKNILLYNSENMLALGPQMQMRIYPNKDLNDIQIRKVGCIYRI